jgi:adenylate cyclase class 1
MLGAKPGGARPSVHIRCHSPSRAAAIAARLGELFADLDRCFGDVPTGAARYVLQIGERLHLLQRDRDGVESESVGSTEELLRLLAEPPAPWCPLTIDRHALTDTPLPAIAPLLLAGQVAVFCERRRDGTRVLVADEGGALFHDTTPGLREPSALAALAQFLGSVRYRRNSTAGAPALDAAARFHRLERDAGGGYSVHPLPEPGAAAGALLAVQAIAERDEHDRTRFVVYCDSVAFSERELGPRFGRELAAHIRTRRPSGAAYPVYITDLDLSALEAAAPGALSTVRYLRERQRLERAINAALRV